MAIDQSTRTAPEITPEPRRQGSTSVLPLLVKIVGLGLAIGAAIAVTPAIIGQQQWVFLVGIWVIVAVLVGTYATGRAVPAKYLVPGTLLLTLFIVVPILLTVQLSFTNYGDGTRTTKQATIDRIVASSVVPTPDSPRYNLTVGTDGSVSSGPFTFFLVDQETGDAFIGTEDGLEPAEEGSVTVEDDVVTEASGYTILTPSQVNAADEEIGEVTVPTEGDNAIRRVGITTAFVGAATLSYDAGADTITDSQTDEVYSVQQDGDRQFFVNADGERISDQSWQDNVGFSNYERIFTDNRISSDFISIFIWTVMFATLSVATTFLLGLLLAITLSDPRVRGQKLYRALLIMPYAIPGFISLLIWSGFFNTDFGLINDVTGLDVNWFGETATARFAVVLTNLWMGFPYMFLVCTGALTSIPEDLKEAANIDGASGFYGFRKITFPLLLVSVAPLLVASFAFNFNNFNAIALLTEGGPFSPANPEAGGTDILISYTIRLAFGAGGAEIGFASAVSVILFILTGVIAAIQFRATRSLEDVN